MFGPYKESSSSFMKHDREAHIITTIIIIIKHCYETKQRAQGPNGDLKPEHKETTNRTAMSPITDIHCQAPTI